MREHVTDFWAQVETMTNSSELIQFQINTPKLQHAFASHFSSLSHLDQALTYAPQAIKDKKEAYQHFVLASLSGKELIDQLCTLDEEKIKLFISTLANDGSSLNYMELEQRKVLAKDAVFAYILKQRDNFSDPINHENYRAIINETSIFLEAVDPKDVIHKLPIGPFLAQNFGQLLKSPQDTEWVDSMLETKALYTLLDDGHEAREAYFDLCTKNLKESLFWARDIYETKLFPDAERLYDETQEKELIAAYNRKNTVLLDIVGEKSISRTRLYKRIKEEIKNGTYEQRSSKNPKLEQQILELEGQLRQLLKSTHRSKERDIDESRIGKELKTLMEEINGVREVYYPEENLVYKNYIDRHITKSSKQHQTDDRDNRELKTKRLWTGVKKFLDYIKHEDQGLFEGRKSADKAEIFARFLNEAFITPNVGGIDVSFCIFNIEGLSTVPPPSGADCLVAILKRHTYQRAGVDTICQELVGSTKFMDAVVVSNVSGPSLDEVQSQLTVYSTEAKCFDELRRAHLTGTRFADLELEMDNEILLSKLIDLHQFSNIWTGRSGSQMRAQLDHLKKAFSVLYKDANEAIALAGLKETVNNVYQQIAGLTKEYAPEIEAYKTKAKNIVKSEKVRAESLAIIEDGNVKDAYDKEYGTLEILKCLIPGSDEGGIDSAAKDKINENIARMATDYEALKDSVAKPLLTPKQDETYFNVMHKIALAIQRQISSESFESLSFKLSHKVVLKTTGNKCLMVVSVKLVLTSTQNLLVKIKYLILYINFLVAQILNCLMGELAVLKHLLR